MNVMFAKVSRWLSVLAVTVMVCLPSQGFAASPDSILSGDIKEADGTSGQDTNTGSGIKTGHIQSGAITTDKLADGAVSAAKLGDNAVITSKILDLGVTSPKLADAAVTNSKLADGAVTDSKIAGPISGSKLGAHAHNGADIIDGTITSSKVADGAITDAKITGPISASKISGLPGKYANVVVVAKSGGDFTDPISAINSITDASSSNKYLLKIMPGTYNIGSNTLNMKEYVDIEGSGRGNTSISGNPSGAYGVVNAIWNAELSNMTVENTGGGDWAVAISALGSANTAGIKLTNLDIIASGGITTTRGVNYDSYSNPPSVHVIINNVDVKVSATTNGNAIGIRLNVYGDGLPGQMNGSADLQNFNVQVSGNQYANYGLSIIGFVDASIINGNIISDGVGISDAGVHVSVQSGKIVAQDSLRSNALPIGSATIIPDIEIFNSNFKGSSSALFVDYGVAKALGTKFDGQLVNVGRPGNVMKVINCVDGSFSPIPNS